MAKQKKSLFLSMKAAQPAPDDLRKRTQIWLQDFSNALRKVKVK
jgi:hypothetical protein